MSAAFELERFVVSDGGLELTGCWRADPQRRFRRVRLLVETGVHIRRLAPLAAATVHATPEGEPWEAVFRWAGEPDRITRAELEVGRDLAVSLPRPSRREPDPEQPGHPEPVGPSALAYRAEVLELTARLEASREEARRRREESAAARAELAGARAEAKRARADADAVSAELASVREELASAREELASAREELASAREELASAREASDTERRDRPTSPPVAKPARRAAVAHHPAHHPPPRRREPRRHDTLTLGIATLALAVPVVVALLVIIESFT